MHHRRNRSVRSRFLWTTLLGWGLALLLAAAVDMSRRSPTALAAAPPLQPSTAREPTAREPTAATDPPQLRGTPLVYAQKAEIVEQRDLVYATYGERKLHLDLFRAKVLAEAAPAIVVVHGGGWTQGDRTRFQVLAQALAARGYVTAAIEYRLAGEAKFPAAIHDCSAAVRWLRSHAKEYGIDPDRIAAVGGSAGGHLVGLMAMGPRVEGLQGDGGSPDASSQIAAAVVMAGPLDLTSGPAAERSSDPKSNSFQWLGASLEQDPARYRLASPLAHFSPDCPPLFCMTGEFDRPTQFIPTREKCQTAGVPCQVQIYPQGKHGCWNQHPWFEAMVDDIDAFLAPILKKTDLAATRARVELPYGELRVGPDRLHLEVTGPPEDGVLRLPRWNNPIRSAYIVGDPPTPLTLSPGVSDWSIKLPAEAIARKHLNIVIETVGRPCSSAIPRVVSPDADGSITLAAHLATVSGKNLRYEPQPHKNTLGYWTNPEDTCAWQFLVERTGKYEVHLWQGCGAGQGGSEVELRVATAIFRFQVEETKGFQDFRERTLGTTILEPGVVTLVIEPKTKAKAAVMDVRQVKLVRVE